jgi:uncharacterized protein YjbI with pentapeptide repeats
MTLDQLVEAVRAASGETRTALVTFTAFAVYVAVTVAATTDVQLLIGGTVTMPLLGVGLPIVGFFMVAPLVLLALHFNLLLQFRGLSVRLQRLMERATSPGEARDPREIALRVPSFFLNELLLHSDGRQLARGLVRASLWLGLVAAPLVILLQIQIRFLPYHDPWVTGLHRLVILADALLAWAFWIAIVAPAASWRGVIADFGIGRSFGLVVTAAAIGLAVIARPPAAPVATAAAAAGGLVMERCQDNDFGLLHGAAPAGPPADAAAVCGIHRVLTVAYAYPPAVWAAPRPVWCPTYQLFDRPDSPFRRSLRVRDARLATEPPEALVSRFGAKPAWELRGQGPDLRGRDLRHADFQGADLRGADLRGADLGGADLARANLSFARAGQEATKMLGGRCAGADGPDGICRANLRGARLAGARAEQTELRGADLGDTQLAFATLQLADLGRTGLSRACAFDVAMHGVKLDGSDLTAASLAKARLMAASMPGARLTGAVMTGARLDFARAPDTELAGVTVDGGRFVPAAAGGVSLAGADLQRATLSFAAAIGPADQDPQPAPVLDLSFADLRGATLDHALPETAPQLRLHRAAVTRELVDRQGWKDEPDALRVIGGSLVELQYDFDLAAAYFRAIACETPDDRAVIEGLLRRAWDEGGFDPSRHVRDSWRALAQAIARKCPDALATTLDHHARLVRRLLQPLPAAAEPMATPVSARAAAR